MLYAFEVITRVMRQRCASGEADVCKSDTTSVLLCALYARRCLQRTDAARFARRYVDIFFFILIGAIPDATPLSLLMPHCHFHAPFDCRSLMLLPFDDASLRRSPNTLRLFYA